MCLLSFPAALGRAKGRRMTTVEWGAALAVVGALWVTALWFFFVGAKQAEVETQHQEAESIRNEIARWKQASERTYARQSHIRRNR